MAERDWRRIDALLECTLFGCEELPWRGKGWTRELRRNGTSIGEPRRLSETWEGAGLVVEAMDQLKPRHTLNLDSSGCARRRARPWWAEFWTWSGRAFQAGADGSDTGPHAIALAALKARGVEVG